MIPRHRWSSQPRSGASGQALVEFALVVPIFFLLVFSIIQLGLVFGAQNAITNAVRETARYTATYRVATNTDAQAVCALSTNSPRAYLITVLARSMPGWDPAGRSQEPISYTWLQNPDGPGGTPGSWYVQINVKVVYKYPVYVPLVGTLLDRADGDPDMVPPGTPDGRLTMSASESMRIENSALAAGFPQVNC
jgi:TadE-like protein